jgi:hypothetical protein
VRETAYTAMRWNRPQLYHASGQLVLVIMALDSVSQAGTQAGRDWK